MKIFKKLIHVFKKVIIILLRRKKEKFLISERKDCKVPIKELEIALLTADIEVKIVRDIVKKVEQKLNCKELTIRETVFLSAHKEISSRLRGITKPLIIDEQKKPYVILVVGINGAGKTTTIGKLSKKYIDEGKRVMLACGDTFRAAAIEQLTAWGESNGALVIKQRIPTHSSAVAYDALKSAQIKNIDILLIDTAGRLHNNNDLMTELNKIKRVLAKLDSSAPHETLLILDANIGQNSVTQAYSFYHSIGISGIVMTKLDGSARGGVIFSISEKLKIPIRFIGNGEKSFDLHPFNGDKYISSLLYSKSDN